MSKDGGPAFPRIDGIEPTGCGGQQSVVVTGGMSLRDYFAGQALTDCGGFEETGLLARLWQWLYKGPAMTDEEIAERCYDQADAMLAARSPDRSGYDLR